jgi:hypothetical protein
MPQGSDLSIVNQTRSCCSIFSPDACTTASASWNKRVKLWRVGTWGLLYRLEGHTNRARSADGHRRRGRPCGQGSRSKTSRPQHSPENRLSHHHGKWTNKWGQVIGGSPFPRIVEHSRDRTDMVRTAIRKQESCLPVQAKTQSGERVFLLHAFNQFIPRFRCR